MNHKLALALCIMLPLAGQTALAQSAPTLPSTGVQPMPDYSPPPPYDANAYPPSDTSALPDPAGGSSGPVGGGMPPPKPRNCASSGDPEPNSGSFPIQAPRPC